MKTSKKTMLAIAITLLLAAALFVGAGAADSGDAPEGTSYFQIGSTIYYTDTTPWYNTLATEMSDTWNVVAENGVITLTLKKDVTGPGIGVFKNKSTATSEEVIIDLGTHTYTLKDPAVGSSGTETQGLHFEDGASIHVKKVTNGNLAVDASNKGKTTGNRIAMISQNYQDIEYNSVNIDGTNLAAWGPGVPETYAFSINSGNVQLTGSTSITVPTGFVAFDVCKFGSYAEPKVTVNTTGIITGKIEYTLSDTTTDENAGSLTITNGTFIGEIVVGSKSKTSAASHLKVNGGSFTDLASAVQYAADNATITLAGNVTGPGFKIGETSDTATPRSIIIDLDKNTYTLTPPAVGSPDHLTQGIRIGNQQNVTIMNGKLDIDPANPGISKDDSTKKRIVWLINNYGTLTLNDVAIDGTNVNQDMDFTKAENVKAVLFSNTGKVDIIGKTSIKAPAGVPALYVGWFKDYPTKGAPTGSVCTNGTDATINTTGTIDGAVAFKMYNSTDPTVAVLQTNGQKLTVITGDLKGGLDVDGIDAFKTYAKSTGITISGGSFTDPTVAQYVQSGGSISVKLDKNYGTKAAGCHVIVPTGAIVTLDLNGKTINGGKDANSGDKDKDKATITNKGDLTIIDSVGTGVIKRADTGAEDLGYYVIVNEGTLTIESGKVTNASYCESKTNGSSLIWNSTESAILTVKGGELTQSKFNVIKNEKTDGQVIINGGTIQCDTDYAILTYGKLEINGGTIKGPVGVFGYKNSATDPAKAEDANGVATIKGGTFTAIGGAFKGLAVVSYTDHAPTDEPSATITGGNFGDGYGLIVGTGTTHGTVEKDTTKGTLLVEGGIFATEPASNYLKAGYVWDKATKEVVKEIPGTPEAIPTGEEKSIDLPDDSGKTPVPEELVLTVNDGTVKEVAVAAIVATAPEDKGAEKTLAAIQIVLVDTENAVINDMANPATFVIKVNVTGLTDSEIARLVIFHGLKNGNWEILTPTISGSGDERTLTFTTKSCSPFIVAVKTPAAAPSKSGSSSWADDTPAQPTAQPTPAQTQAPVDTPTVVPIETPTPATPAPFIGILAGLGAAAAVFGLRRK